MTKGLKILYRKAVISLLIFLAITLIYFLELKFWLSKKIDNLANQYQQKLNLVFQTAQQITRKKELENFEKDLQTNLGFSLAEAVNHLKNNLPYLEKENLKKIFKQKNWSVDWLQTSPGQPPQAKIVLKKSDLGKFFQFLKETKIAPEITNFTLTEKEGGQIELTLIFAQ